MAKHEMPGFLIALFCCCFFGASFADQVVNEFSVDPAHQRLYFLTHGRDALYTLYPENFNAEDSAELPSEEMHVLVDGGDYGWPLPSSRLRLYGTVVS